MNSSYMYKSHRIDVDVFPRCGRWGWCYQIDDGPRVHHRCETFSRDEAFLKASDAAQMAIDRRP